MREETILSRLRSYSLYSSEIEQTIVSTFSNFSQDGKIYQTHFLAACIFMHGLLTVKILKSVFTCLDLKQLGIINSEILIHNMFNFRSEEDLEMLKKQLSIGIII